MKHSVWNKLTALLLVCALMCATSAVTAAAAWQEPAVRYIVDGRAAGSGYTLEIRAEGLIALTGRIALAFDTDKLQLQGGDSLSAFRMANGLSAVPEVKPESEMVSASKGYACLAWYGSGVDATRAPQTIASLNFAFKAGYSAQDIDAGSFRLLPIQDGDMGPFQSAASFRAFTNSDLPTTYEYMTDRLPCGVSFTYEGSNRIPADYHTLSVHCENNLGEAVSGTLEINGRVYPVERGSASAALAPGEYLWRIQSDGYGNQSGRVVLDGDKNLNVTVLSDATLVRQAKDALEIGFQKGDSAEHVTGTLQLTNRTAEGVDVTWSSSHPNIITSSGLVYLPDRTGETVTVTAALSRGTARETKDFTLYVCSKAEVYPVGPSDVPNFVDLTQYGWAREAIEGLAKAGIVNGRDDTHFAPGANVTRGEFITMLMRMIDPAGSPACTFTDVPADMYYYKPIAQAQALGIANGTGGNRFEPNKPITRQEMITLTVRAMDATKYYPMTNQKDSLERFTDRNRIADYALENIQRAVGQNLIQGVTDNTVQPLSTATRAETAMLMWRIYSAHTA